MLVRARRIAYVVGALVVLSALITWGVVLRVQAERAAVTAAWRARLTAMAGDRALAIDEWLAARLEQARMIAADRSTAAWLEACASSRARPGQSESGKRLADLLTRTVLAKAGRNVWVADAGAREVAHDSQGQPFPAAFAPVAMGAMAAGLGRADIVVHQPDGPTLVLAAPVAPPDLFSSAPGAAVIAVDPHLFLYPLLASESTPTRTGETLLVSISGQDVRYLSPRRDPSRPWLGPAAPRPDLSRLIASGTAERGSFGRFVDSRGEYVIAATRSLRSAPWAVVVRVDQQEAFGSLAANVVSEASTLVAAALALLGVGYGLWWRQRARLRATLVDSEARHQRLVQVANEGIWTLDADLRTDFVNPKLAEWLGYEVADVVGLPVSAFLFPEDYADHALQMQARRRGQSGIYERRLRCRDGSERWMVVGETAILDSQGRFAGLLAMLTDITARKRAEAGLRDNEARLRAVLDTSVEAIVTADERGMIESFNPAAEQLFQLPAPQAIGRPLGELVLGLDPGETTVGGVPREVEGARPDGSRVPLSIVVSSFEAGGRRGRTAMIRDLTEVKHAEAKLRDAEARLVHAQKMEAVGRLAGGVAHDFNNLLGIIHGFGDLARRALPDDHPVQPRLETMLNAADKGATLTRQLLAFARREPQEAAPLDLNRVVAGLESMLRRLIGEDVTLVTRLAEGLPRTLGDAGRIEQVIVNLAVNARDAMPQGGRLTVATALEQLEGGVLAVGGQVAPGRYLRLSVCDTGSGMDDATLAHAFEPFFTTKAVGKGTGLGLAMVHGIVTQAGGYVRVESRPGHGTDFHVLLPVLDHGSVRADVRAPAAAEAPRRGSETVLVVEDDKDLREIVAESLTSFGYRVLSAAGGEEALRLADGFVGEVHLLLTDVVMPEMSGKTLADRIRSVYPSVRVLFMSGYTDDAFDRYEIANLQAGFIRKPFTAEQLVSQIRAALADGGDRGPGSPAAA